MDTKNRTTRPTLPDLPTITPMRWQHQRSVVDDMPEHYATIPDGLAPIFEPPSYTVSILIGVIFVAIVIGGATIAVKLMGLLG